MKLLKISVSLIFLLASFCASSQSNSTDQILSSDKIENEPWEIIFNGKDFTGWSIIGSNGKAWVEDGIIITHMVDKTHEHTFIQTNKEYEDFIMEADFKIDGNIHTGFLLRTQPAPDTAKVCIYGYQVKIDPTDRRWTGGIFDDFGRSFSWWYTLADDPRARAAFKMNEWNHCRIEAIDNNIKVWVNDVPTCNMINSKYKKGPIALKIHSLDNDPKREVTRGCFKDIRIISKSPKKYVREMDLVPKKFD